MKAVQTRLTYPELRLIPEDGNRYELIDGELIVSPSPSEKHQRALGRLFLSIANHIGETRRGKVYFAPLDVVFGEKTALQPDLIFVSAARAGIIGPEYILGAPDLVVEVLSPSGTTYDRVRKLEQYRRYGVGEYWIVDPAAENVEVYRLAGNGYILTGTSSGEQRLQTPLLPEWTLQVRDLFSE